MSDNSPAIRNAIPALVETSIPNNTPQPIPLSKRQAPPEPLLFCPPYPAGLELVETVEDRGGYVTEKVSIGGKLFLRRFNRETGDGGLSPL